MVTDTDRRRHRHRDRYMQTDCMMGERVSGTGTGTACVCGGGGGCTHTRVHALLAHVSPHTNHTYARTCTHTHAHARTCTQARTCTYARTPSPPEPPFEPGVSNPRLPWRLHRAKQRLSLSNVFSSYRMCFLTRRMAMQCLSSDRAQDLPSWTLYPTKVSRSRTRVRGPTIALSLCMRDGYGVRA